MTIEVVRRLPDGQWREFVAATPGGNVFQTPEMFETFRRARGHRPSLLAARRAGEVLALLVPVEVAVGPDVARRVATRSIVYGGILHVPGPDGINAVDRLLRTHEASVHHAVLLTELRHIVDAGPVGDVLEANGYTYEDHLNYLIDLDRPADDLLASISRSTRKQIRRGLRQGEVLVEDAVSREDLTAWYRILEETYRNARVPLADASLFRAAHEVLVPRGMVRFVLARIGETIVAASAELAHGDTVYGWYGGVDRQYSRSTPNELLMWDVLRRASEEGYRVYDFGGAGRPDEAYGVRDFKAKFGGDLVCYGRHTRTHAPVRLRLARAGYEMYRRLPSGARV